MTTDLWYVILETERKYPKIGALKKLRKVYRQEYVLDIAVTEECSEEMKTLWEVVKKYWDVRKVAAHLGTRSQGSVSVDIGTIWDTLLNKARSEINA